MTRKIYTRDAIQIALDIKQFILTNNLTRPYGGMISVLRRSRSYPGANQEHYSIPFSKEDEIDGAVSIYRGDLVSVEYTPWPVFPGSPPDDVRFFNSGQHAISFINLAFVEMNILGALTIPTIKPL